MRPILCDRCDERIDDKWTGPALEVSVHKDNGVDNDVAGDYCVRCAAVVADAIRDVMELPDDE